MEATLNATSAVAEEENNDVMMQMQNNELDDEFANAHAKNVEMYELAEEDDTGHEILVEDDAMNDDEDIAAEGSHEGQNNLDVDDNDVFDIINQSLEEFLIKAQEEADKAAVIATKKQEEADAAQVEAQEKLEKMNVLREKAQTLADDEKWTDMCEKLRVWSKEKGHCNPR